MKEKVKRAGILTFVFLIAVIVFSFLTNQGNADMTADMGGATLPRIQIVSGEYEINPLVGYVSEMNVGKMRSTITPVDFQSGITLRIEEGVLPIKALTYEVCSSDGKEILYKEKRKEIGEEPSLTFPGLELADREAILKLTLHTEKQDIYYYTRICTKEGTDSDACLAFAERFHNMTFGKENTESIAAYLENGTEDDETENLQKVTIHSDAEHLTWGELRPQIKGEVSRSIKEISGNYMTIVYDYEVECAGEQDETEVYQIREYLKVRYAEGTEYLLDYERTMEQELDASGNVLDNNGILLGIAKEELPYMANEAGTIVSFVQAGELWNYNQSQDALSLVFSFADSEGYDIRNLCKEHEIQIVSVNEQGDTTFKVIGYMNRGEHEGEVGTAIYFFDIEKNFVEEKAFIPDNISSEILLKEQEQLVYYNEQQEVLYAMKEGTLYKVDLEKGKKEALVENLEKDQYVSSKDGRLLAYQTVSSLENAEEVKVLDFVTGKERTVTCSSGEFIRPLGFISEDFVYGIGRKEDAGAFVTGEHVCPMYKLEIRDTDNEVVKTYQADQVYVTGVTVEEKMLILDRVVKNESVYTAVAKDYITSNEEVEKSNISVETYTSDEKERQVRIKYESGISDKKPKLLKPKQVLFENPVLIPFEEEGEAEVFYTYGKGKLLGIYASAADAIRQANENQGLVVSESQKYVWERGNRSLVYDIAGVDLSPYQEGNILAAALNRLFAYEGKTVDAAGEMAAGKKPIEILQEQFLGNVLDLHGCSPEELCYILGKGTPIIAMTDLNNAVLLIGYNDSMITYVKPDTGEKVSVPYEELEALTVASGNTYLGYLK
ncbi:hypothetical protein [Faecalimonas umbilicata]|uniref:hypothetical protein n=1 Tax=Faecalimonas umbilicata TaxID=1912855 RepID=UPI002942BE3B|nr:hypothetical protein [Faecalimonas umbilicata]